MTSFDLKFNPNTLLQFRRLFLLYRSASSSDVLSIYVSQSSPNPTFLFMSPLSKSNSCFSYFELFDDTFLDDLQIEAPELLIEIPDAPVFCKFLRSFSEKISSFSLHYSASVLTLVNAEGSEFRTRTIANVKELDPTEIKDKQLKLNERFKLNVITREIAKMSDCFQGLDGCELLFAVSRSAEAEFELRLEITGLHSLRTLITSKKGDKSIPAPETFRFLFDKSRAKTLSTIACIDEIASLAITNANELVLCFDKFGENQQRIYSMKFSVPFLSEMEEMKDEGSQAEDKRKRRETKKRSKKGLRGNSSKENSRAHSEERKQDSEPDIERIKEEVEEYEDFDNKTSNIY